MRKKGTAVKMTSSKDKTRELPLLLQSLVLHVYLFLLKGTLLVQHG